MLELAVSRSLSDLANRPVYCPQQLPGSKYQPVRPLHMHYSNYRPSMDTNKTGTSTI